jgi:16S rRNA (uracil1498-N3)-methyltransferase
VSVHRFFLAPEVFNQSEVVFPAETARQISSVLRLKRGQSVIVLDNLGNCRPVVLDEVDNRHVTAAAGDIQPAPGEPKVKLILCPALTQREKFEWILQKGCELGVSEFQPVLTSRTLSQDTRGWEDKLTRWQKILQEAAEQCGRGLIPSIKLPQRFDMVIGNFQHIPGFILHEQEQDIGLAGVLQGITTAVALFVGPEGGFSEEEVNLGKSVGLNPVSLGQRVLRMETAALTACAVFMAVTGELGNFSISK